MLLVEVVPVQSTDFRQQGFVTRLIRCEPVHHVEEVLLEEGLDLVSVLLLCQLV